MKASTATATSLAAIIQVVRAADPAGYYREFSNALSTGPVADNTWIREANTTLILPALNSPQTGNLCLWPGMGTSNGDLIQGLAISVRDSASTGTEECPDEDKWCIVASTLQDDYQKSSTTVAAEEGQYVTFHYKYNDDTDEYDQTVSLDGQAVSTLSTSSGKAEGWGTAVECQSAACGTVYAHQYIDTTIIMDTADSTYDQTLGLTGATGDMVTDDGGKTWTIATISIDEHTYT